MAIKIGIISMYANPLHEGHIRLIQEAYDLMDEIIVIINNDKQQILKKGKIIMNEDEREYIVSNINNIKYTELSIDKDTTVVKSLKKIIKNYKIIWNRYPITNSKTDLQFYFINGGNDRTNITEIPEYKVCKKLGIRMLFGVGGSHKSNSSKKINKLLGKEC